MGQDGVRVRDRFTVVKAFSEYLSIREDWVQDILGYYTKSLPDFATAMEVSVTRLHWLPCRALW